MATKPSECVDSCASQLTPQLEHRPLIFYAGVIGATRMVELILRMVGFQRRSVSTPTWQRRGSLRVRPFKHEYWYHAGVPSATGKFSRIVRRFAPRAEDQPAQRPTVPLVVISGLGGLVSMLHFVGSRANAPSDLAGRAVALAQPKTDLPRRQPARLAAPRQCGRSTSRACTRAGRRGIGGGLRQRGRRGRGECAVGRGCGGRGCARAGIIGADAGGSGARGADYVGGARLCHVAVAAIRHGSRNRRRHRLPLARHVAGVAPGARRSIAGSVQRACRPDRLWVRRRPSFCR